MLSKIQKKFIALEKEREVHKQYFKDLNEATQAVADEIGIGKYFQDDRGTVFKIVVPTGRWVEFEQIGYVRTRRADESKGSLSLKEAQEAGFSLAHLTAVKE